MLLSLRFHQLVGKKKYSSYCNEGVTLCRRYSCSACKNVKSNIARPRAGVLLKMYDNLQSAWKHITENIFENFFAVVHFMLDRTGVLFWVTRYSTHLC